MASYNFDAPGGNAVGDVAACLTAAAVLVDEQRVGIPTRLRRDAGSADLKLDHVEVDLRVLLNVRGRARSRQSAPKAAPGGGGQG